MRELLERLELVESGMELDDAYTVVDDMVETIDQGRHDLSECITKLKYAASDVHMANGYGKKLELTKEDFGGDRKAAKIPSMFKKRTEELKKISAQLLDSMDDVQRQWDRLGETQERLEFIRAFLKKMPRRKRTDPSRLPHKDGQSMTTIQGDLGKMSKKLRRR